ncbi:hypothetical protein [Parenemella sanctibonifatiensis]|uniref:hypothetical protein n=1 Tax=Parenemella sanctibonifatiensis TaxID=2016505 RepID=UPI0015C62D3C|nr:hypothetical protein [Parenemella sanctibonifatiensis]
MIVRTHRGHHCSPLGEQVTIVAHQDWLRQLSEVAGRILPREATIYGPHAHAEPNV